MIVELYAVKDVKASFYAPSTFETEEVAKRNFKIMMSEDNMKMFRSDWELWKLGHYDNKTGVITQDQPEFIMSGEDIHG